MPGKVWGHYASDEETRQWAVANAVKRFKVGILRFHSESDSFEVQHGDESPFVVAYEFIWPYLQKAQQKLIVENGGRPPTKQSLSVQAKRSRKPSRAKRARAPPPVLAAHVAAARARRQAILVNTSLGNTQDDSARTCYSSLPSTITARAANQLKLETSSRFQYPAHLAPQAIHGVSWFMPRALL